MGGQAPWVVNTYDDSSAGRISVAAATVRSDNSVYAQLCMDIGPENVVETAQKMGITSPLAAVPSITLGTEAVNPLEMAVAYATLASGGIYHPPQAIVKVVVPGGKVDWKPKIKGRRVLSAGVAYTVNKILQTNASSGTGAGTAAYVPRTRAGKTGTTDNYVDAWYCGYTPNLSTAVWMGYSGDYEPPHARGGRLDLLRADVGQVQQDRARRPAGRRLRVRLHGLQAVEGQVLDDVAVAVGEQRQAVADGDQDHQADASPDGDADEDPTPTPTPTKTPTPTPTPTGALTWLSEAATRAIAQAVGGLFGF